MEYTVRQMAELTGLTPRTLRYYDEIGLLCPRRDAENDYRLYSSQEVDRLQQILLYREMGLPLETIRKLLDMPDFDRAGALREHLRRLLEQQRRVETLIRTVSRTLKMIDGGYVMNDKEKFEGMKQRVIAENEAVFGQEVRERYGRRIAEDSRKRMAGMSEEDWKQMQEQETGYQAALKRAIEKNDPEGEDAREACRLHKAWLLHYWTPEMLTEQAHIGLAEMYVQDERFTAYYEKIAPGCAEFFRRIIRAFYQQ